MTFYIPKMPKFPARANSKSLQYEREFPNKFRANPTGDLFCILCCQTVNCGKPFRVESHQSSAKHKKLISKTVNTAEKWQKTFIPILKKNFKASWLRPSWRQTYHCSSFNTHRSASPSSTLDSHLKTAASMWTS